LHKGRQLAQADAAPPTGAAAQQAT